MNTKQAQRGPVHIHKLEEETENNSGASSSRINPAMQKTLPVSMNATAGKIRWKKGTITEATEDYVIHQCNCVQNRPAKGAAAYIFNEFEEADVYQKRHYSKRTFDAPGAISTYTGNYYQANHMMTKNQDTGKIHKHMYQRD